jgi:hypothetical protein
MCSILDDTAYDGNAVGINQNHQQDSWSAKQAGRISVCSICWCSSLNKAWMKA